MSKRVFLKSASIVSVCVACVVGAAMDACAWDVEHDEIAQLVGESLPAEIKASFDFDDFGVLMAFCHFPDMTEWEPRRWRTVDDYAPHIGPDDRAILAAAGCGGYWAHTEKGKATLMALLARAFGRGDHRVAAFYLSVLTHPVGDESALNHPTILNFVHYCHYQGVAFGTRKVEAGAKNIFGFRSDGDVVRRARAKLKGYRPSAPAVAGFGGLLADRAPEELPVSPGWHKEGACPDWRKMAVVLDGVRHPLRRDANGDGYAKPACAQEILPGPGIEPLAYLDNGRARFCVAARKGNVTWLPVYLLSPFLFSDVTALDFGALRLDPFAEKVLLSAVEGRSAR